MKVITGILIVGACGIAAAAIVNRRKYSYEQFIANVRDNAAGKINDPENVSVVLSGYIDKNSMVSPILYIKKSNGKVYKQALPVRPIKLKECPIGIQQAAENTSEVTILKFK